MQDSLIGYLIGSLDDDELARFEARLERDPELQAQLHIAAQSLRVLKLDPDDDIEPPAGLVDATCGFVQQASQVTTPVTQSARFDRNAESAEWSMTDLMVACFVLFATCLLLFPALNNSRHHAQIAGCQNNLRSIGRALLEYSGANAQGIFPQVPEFGNLAVAGMYAPTLISSGLVTEDHRFFCPSSSDIEAELIRRIPTMEEINQARGQTLAVAQHLMGGDYGYTLGVIKNGQLQGIRNRFRTQFAIMSDSPKAFSCDSTQIPKGLHRNVLFESGGVRVVRIDMDCWCGDQLYTNDQGEVLAGLHDGDAVIAPSDTSPILLTGK